MNSTSTDDKPTFSAFWNYEQNKPEPESDQEGKPTFSETWGYEQNEGSKDR